MADLVRVPRSEMIPTSPHQDIWLNADKLLKIPGTTYCVGYRIEISGRFNSDTFQKATNKIIEDHEILRTSYVSKEGRNYQAIQNKLEFSVPFIDHSKVAKEEREKIYSQTFNEFFVLSLPAYKAPLWRLIIFNISEEEQTLIIGMHHSICDAQGINNFLDELIRNYDYFEDQTQLPDPRTEFQYADFSVWYRRQLEEGAFEEATAYWKNRVSIGQSESKVKKQIVKANSHLSEISMAQLEALKSFVKEKGFLFSTLLIGIVGMLLLHRTRKDKIFIEIIHFGRSQEELWRMLGEFSLPCPLLIDGSNDPTFLELLSRVSDELLLSFENEFPANLKYDDNLCCARFNFVPTQTEIKSKHLNLITNADQYFSSETARVSSMFETYYFFMETLRGLQAVLRTPADIPEKNEYSKFVCKMLPKFVDILISEPSTGDLRISEIIAKFK